MCVYIYMYVCLCDCVYGACVCVCTIYKCTMCIACVGVGRFLRHKIKSVCVSCFITFMLQ